MKTRLFCPIACPEETFSGWGYLFNYVALTCLWFVIFLGVYIAVRHAMGAGIVFYSGHLTVLGVGILNVLIFIAVWRVTSLRRYISRNFLISLLGSVSVTYVLLGYAFVTTIPTLLDRSISIFMIAAVAQEEDAGITLGDLNTAFLRGYVDGSFQVEKRLEEQLATDNFETRGDRIYITPRGRFVYRTNVYLARLFNISDRYVQAGTGRNSGKGVDVSE